MSESVVQALTQCGGSAGRAELLTLVTLHELRTAVAAGVVERVGHGRYALPGLDDSLRAAHALAAVASHRSGALRHGWSVWRHPPRPELVVPRYRDIPAQRRRGVDLRWRDLGGEDTDDRVTTHLRTVVDCARDLPLPDALAVADSALRAGDVTEAELAEAIAVLPRTGRARATRVLRNASKDAANPFESATRALAIESGGPIFTPQVPINLGADRVIPDLVSEDLRMVIECDSYTFHTKPDQLMRDCWRYDELTLAGWLVLRFVWRHVMYHEDWVRATIAHGVTQRS